MLNKTFALAALLLATTIPTISAEPQWRPLFNGKDLSGWKMCGPGEFKIEDNCLATYGGMGLLWYEKEKLGDCEIKVVFKMTGEKDNSGVYIRIKDDPKSDPWFAVHNGYEVQITPNDDPTHGGGCLYSFLKRKNDVKLEPGKWITYLIRLEGDRTVVKVDGVETVDYTEGQPVVEKKGGMDPNRGPRARSGYIGLQNHNDGSKVLFKEVSIRPLK